MTFSLVESHRVHGSSRQRALLNLGQTFDLPKAQWRRLTQLVEDELRGLPPLPLEDEVLLQTNQRLAQRLRAKGYDIHDSRDDRDAVLIHEIQHADTRTVGGERVVLRALQLLGFNARMHRGAMSYEPVTRSGDCKSRRAPAGGCPKLNRPFVR